MIAAIAYGFGGTYAALAAFFIGAVLILIGLSRKDEGDDSLRLKPWHKYGLAASILCIVALICFGIYRHYGLPPAQSTTTDTSSPSQPLTPLESFTVSPIKLVFKDQYIGKSSSPQTVTVVNRASTARIITAINATGNFSQTNDCGSELMVGDSCNVEVKFTPTTLGLTHGNLEISCHDPLFSSVKLSSKVDFSGSGIAHIQRGALPDKTPNPISIQQQTSGDCSPATVGNGNTNICNTREQYPDMSIDQAKQLAGALSGYKNRSLTVSLIQSGASKETVDFQNHLAEALGHCGFSNYDRPSASFAGSFPPGIFATVGRNNLDFLHAIETSLNSMGFIKAPIPYHLKTGDDGAPLTLFVAEPEQKVQTK
jgi:hypothetical protein